MSPRIALLPGDDFDYMLTLVMAMGEARFGIPDPSLPTAAPRPLAPLPDGDAVLVGSSWVSKQRDVDVTGGITSKVRRRFGRVIGLDQETSFQLQFSDEMLAALDAVIKPNGVYRDPHRYSRAPENVARLHLSAPCFAIVGLEALSRAMVQAWPADR